MSTVYGVTSTTLGEYVHGLTFSTTTKPTTAEAGNVIARYAKRWSNLIESRGFTAATVQADSTHAAYVAGEQWIGFRSASDLQESRTGRTSTLTERLKNKADELREEWIEETEIAAGADFNNAEGDPGRWSSSSTTTLTTAQKADRSFHQTMVDEGQM